MRCLKHDFGWTQYINKPNIKEVKCPICGEMHAIKGQLVLIRADLIEHYKKSGVWK